MWWRTNARQKPGECRKSKLNRDAVRRNKYVDTDTKTSRTFWNVLYSDGHSGDLWDDEMIRWCIDQEAGTHPGIQVTKTNHPLSEGNSVSAKHASDDCRPDSFLNSTSIDADSFVFHNDKKILIDSLLITDHLPGGWVVSKLDRYELL